MKGNYRRDERRKKKKKKKMGAGLSETVAGVIMLTVQMVIEVMQTSL